MQEWLDIATLVDRKSLKGELVVLCTANSPSFLREGMQMAVVPPQLDAPRHLTIRSISSLRQDSAIVSFEEIEDASTADALVGCHCLMKKEDIPDDICRGDDAHNAAVDLMGFTLIDEYGTQQGTVCRIEDNPAQPLLVVMMDDQKEVLVPFVDDFIVHIDEGSKAITMALPSGLLDI